MDELLINYVYHNRTIADPEMSTYQKWLQYEENLKAEGPASKERGKDSPRDTRDTIHLNRQLKKKRME